MTWESVACNREDLYEEVWTEPVWEVAKRYGISDVALAKICRKLTVPVPGRGYWAKRSAGQKVRRKPLPRVRKDQPVKHEVQVWRDPTNEQEMSDEAQQLLEQERVADSPIVVSDELVDPHPLIRKSLVTLRRAKKDSDAFIYERACLNIRVTKANLDRALRTTDALLKALDAREMQVQVTRPGESIEPDSHYRVEKDIRRSRTGVLLLGSFLEFSIEEIFRTVRIEPKTSREATSRSSRVGFSWDTARFERRPTGRLALKLKECHGRGLRRVWADGKNQRIERCINSFIVGLIRAAEVDRISRLETERRRERWEEEEQRRQEQAEDQALQAQLIEDLDARLANWNKAEAIREFLAVVEKRVFQSGKAVGQDSDLGRWLAWVRAYADGLEVAAIQNHPANPGPLERSTPL